MLDCCTSCKMLYTIYIQYLVARNRTRPGPRRRRTTAGAFQDKSILKEGAS